MSNVTQLLDAAAQGDQRAAAAILPLVYDELRRLAAVRMAQEAPNHTLDATALVREAYLRLVEKPHSEGDEPRWDNRGHFFAAAAEAMRRILVEYARRRKSQQRGGGRQRLDLLAADQPVEPSDDLLALDEALTRLAVDDPIAARIVELHHFAGLSIEQAAEALGISRAKAYRDWTYARAWLQKALED